MAIYSLPSIWYAYPLGPGILVLEKVLPSQHEPEPMVAMATGWVGSGMQGDFVGFCTFDIVKPSPQFAHLDLATTQTLENLFIHITLG